MPSSSPSSAEPRRDAGSGGRVVTGSVRSAIETVVLATDLGRPSEAATTQAIVLAVGLKARLLILNVVDQRRGRAIGGQGKIRPVEEREARALAARDVVQQARAAGADARFLVWDGDIAEGIVAAADAEHANVIVMGTRGRAGVERSILGSVSDDVIRHAHCPVMVVRPSLNDRSGWDGRRVL
jgi:nucleotide-binding universal stress UspA family protein